MNITNLFESIENANSIANLQSLMQYEEWQKEIEKLNTKYPPLQFALQSEEITLLVKKGILSEQHQLQLANIPIDDPLLKLLTSLIWKNGDLSKIQHIADGITGKNTSTSKQNIIFRQFGKSLTKTGAPIIDQHVLRAFGCFKYPEKKEYFIKKKIYKNSDLQVVNDYITWFLTKMSKIEELEKKSFAQLMDRILFIAGKKIQYH